MDVDEYFEVDVYWVEEFVLDGGDIVLVVEIWIVEECGVVCCVCSEGEGQKDGVVGVVCCGEVVCVFDLLICYKVKVEYGFDVEDQKQLGLGD